MLPGTPPRIPDHDAAGARRKSCRRRELEDEIGALIGLGHGASNEWVVAGSRTVTGKPILANDPHLGTRRADPLVSRPHRHAGRLGQGRHRARHAGRAARAERHRSPGGSPPPTPTSQDLFVETVDPTDPAKYLTPDGPKPFETRDETIHVKDAPDVKLHDPGDPARARPVRREPGTRRPRRPWQSDGARLHRPRRPGYDYRGDDARRRRAQLGRIPRRVARSIRRRRRTSSMPTSPATSASSAPASCRCASRATGSRRSTAPRAHSTGSASCRSSSCRSCTIRQIGFAFNANNAIVRGRSRADVRPGLGGGLPRAPHPAILRHDRQAQPGHLRRDAGRPRCRWRRRPLQPLIATIAPSDERARQALAMLAGWNAVMDKDRAEPLIFTAFLSSLHRILLSEKTGLKIDAKGPFAATTLIFADARPSVMVRRAGQAGPRLPDALRASARRGPCAARQARRRRHEQMAPGAPNRRACSRHKFYSHVPLLDRISDLSVPSSGGFYTLDRGGGFETPQDKPFARTHGADFAGSTISPTRRSLAS